MELTGAGETAESSISNAALESLYSELAREPHHDLKGIVIVRNGRVSGERYFNGDSVNTLWMVYIDHKRRREKTVDKRVPNSVQEQGKETPERAKWRQRSDLNR